MSHHLTLRPRGPLIARDGRPFGIGQGLRMTTLDWPYPSVLAGSLRSLLGKRDPRGFDPEVVAALKAIAISGPLPAVEDTLFLPAPKDVLVSETEKGERHYAALRPDTLSDGEGSDLPAGLRPVTVGGDGKPAAGPAFWSLGRMTAWLTEAAFEVPPPPEQARPKQGWLAAIERDRRVHVAIEPGRGAADEGKLFLTEGLDVEGVDLAVRVEADAPWAAHLDELDALHPVGGERRLAHWRSKASPLWECPNGVATALKGALRVRLVLATPALFAGGWRPGWLDAETLKGQPPGTGVTLKLEAACVERWRPISGWSLEKGSFGPKPVRRLVPAGSVYFFEVIDGDPGGLAEAGWLRSVCDDGQDRRDGFGLALWGVWNEAGESEHG